ncbi:cytochrome P450 2K1-like [Leuresthes tenuis]|uniref:cytochrome P450 2K1-like n=1 Tax=Leuresthes tenuis TaxID=355514 RepID=UPI003B50230D
MPVDTVSNMGIVDVLLQSFISVSLLGSLAALLLIYFISSFIFRSEEKRKEPPGPIPLPLLGNLLQLDLKKPHTTLLEFSKKYGSVFTVYFGSKKVVVLAGYKTVKEALVNYDEAFGERDAMHILHEINQGSGILWSNGDSWREMRRFALTNLRDFGMGKKACEDKIIEESQHLINAIKEIKGEAVDTAKSVNYAVCNIICSMIYGSRCEYDDSEFTSLVDRLGTSAQLLGSRSIQVYNIFPFCKWISSRRHYYKLHAASRKHAMALISQMKETLIPQMCRGFVDAFLVRKQNLEESAITKNHYNENNLLMTVLHLFAAGTETTSTTLRWGLLLMAKYPKIQKQVQEELRRVIADRQVQVADRKNLPFTDAVIHETLRLTSIIPMSLPHKTSRDITFYGHFIGKGTTVYPLLTSVLHDPTEWEKPNTFYPAHFLDKDGNFVKRDAFIPFSAGRRICVGESLARMELFIFFTTLLQHFRFTPPPGVSEDELDLTPQTGITLIPSAHKLCALSCM